jgi:hypothetical protein
MTTFAKLARRITAVVVGSAAIASVTTVTSTGAYARSSAPYLSFSTGTYTQGGGQGPEIGTQIGWGSQQSQVIGNLPIPPATTCAVGTPTRFQQSVVHRAADGDQLFATNELSGCLVQGGVTRLTGTETFTGGTGRFAGATGVVTNSAVLDDTTDPVPLSGRFRVTRYGSITLAR